MADQEPMSFTHVPSHLGCQIWWCVCQYSAASLVFFHHPTNRAQALAHQSDGLSLWDETISRPCTATCFLPPPPEECLFPHSMYLHTDRPREGIYGSLNPLAPGKEQGHPNRLLRAIWKCLLFTSSCLVSYLFLCGLL